MTPWPREFGRDETVDGDYVVLGPWIWCFTSEDRVKELKSHPFFSGSLERGVAVFPAMRLLQEAGKNSASLLINPTLAFRRRFGLAEIKDLLARTA